MNSRFNFLAPSQSLVLLLSDSQTARVIAEK
jgi:hypothetical protein